MRDPISRIAAASPMPATAGVGLRLPHHATVLERRPAVPWFEVHPENYMSDPQALSELEDLRRDYPLSLHAVGLSLGSADGIDAAHLARLAQLARRLQPALVSDHLSWSTAAGVYLPDLLPLPYTDEALAVVAGNVDRVQQALGRQLLLENPSTYLRYVDSSLSEAQFLASLVSRCGCGVLLDVNNIYVSAFNQRDDAAATLAALLNYLPGEAIAEIHLAGHALVMLDSGAECRIDDHGSRVATEVWALYEQAIRHLGPRPTLIEWDTRLPDFEVLLDEARHADRLSTSPVSERSVHDLAL